MAEQIALAIARNGTMYNHCWILTIIVMPLPVCFLLALHHTPMSDYSDEGISDNPMVLLTFLKGSQ
jgi:hypothetical protein